jgi:hypothetical protein
MHHVNLKSLGHVVPELLPMDEESEGESAAHTHSSLHFDLKKRSVCTNKREIFNFVPTGAEYPDISIGQGLSTNIALVSVSL